MYHAPAFSSTPQWTLPDPNFVKISCDAFYDVSIGRGVVTIIRDEFGCVIGGNTKVFLVPSAAMAEAITVRLGDLTSHR
ncbi:hypothetical protein V6N12_075284 [Hibiscus sabdariffa]|uniref:RNase H type-1 domain-containing protein n=1 Tax=Hibiscus sabdariffa TaxID=183260 RepID=A0ABR2C757_9ROSI